MSQLTSGRNVGVQRWADAVRWRGFIRGNGGKTTVETLSAGETGIGTIDFEGAGSTLTVDETLTLGSNGDGILTLAKGGALVIEGAFDMAENTALPAQRRLATPARL